jgi:hypothetical protein
MHKFAMAALAFLRFRDPPLDRVDDLAGTRFSRFLTISRDFVPVRILFDYSYWLHDGQKIDAGNFDVSLVVAASCLVLRASSWCGAEDAAPLCRECAGK